MKTLILLFAACMPVFVMFVTPATADDANTGNSNLINEILTELKMMRKDKHECKSRLDELEKQLTNVKDVETRLELAELRIQVSR